MGTLWARYRRGAAALSVVAALGVISALAAGCGSPADESATATVRAVLSTEDASDILPGSTGDFVVMVHLDADGSTIPLVMLTPRSATTYSPYLASGDAVYVMDVPDGAAWPLVDTELSWTTAIISSESQLRPDVLTRTATELPVAATLDEAQADDSITAWTQRNESHMAGVYVITGDDCVPAVVRQTTSDQWLLTAVPGWTNAADLAALVDDAPTVVLSDSTRVNPSRVSACAPGG
jgi:hypothetical protein